MPTPNRSPTSTSTNGARSCDRAFGAFRYDRAAGLLWRGDQEIVLPPKAGDLLEYLTERPGVVISKNELLEVVWNDGFVAEQSVIQAISILRHALEDDPKTPNYIQTLPRRGYRFIADVQRSPALVPKTHEEPSTATRTLPRAAWIAALMAALATGVLTGYEIAGSTRGLPVSLTSAPAAPVRLTRLSGRELSPDFSPDGKMLVYSGDATGSYDIYLMRIGGHQPINLTAGLPGNYLGPTFSSDGQRIALRSDRGGGGIYVMGATGEEIRRLTTFGSMPSWSPSGEQIVFEAPGKPRGLAMALWVVQVDTGASRQLTEGSAPAWSPPGGRIAYIFSEGGNSDIWTVRPDGTDPRPLLQTSVSEYSPAWAPDSWCLYFSRRHDGGNHIWRVETDAQTGQARAEPQQVTFGEPIYRGEPMPSADGRFLAYAAGERREYLQSVAFDPVTATTLGDPALVRVAGRRVTEFDVAPDGSEIAFVRSEPSPDLALIHPDGTGERLLTDDAFTDFSVSWAPDGERIAFASDRSGQSEIWTIAAAGGSPLRLTPGTGYAHVFPVWSPDSRLIAYHEVGETIRVKLLDVQKRLPYERLPTLPRHANADYFVATSWSPDGQLVAGYRMRNGVVGLTTFSLEDGSYHDHTEFGRGPIWLLDSRRMLFVHASSIMMLDVRTGEVKKILSFLSGSLRVRLSRDSRRLYFVHSLNEVDLWMIALAD